MNFTSLAFLCFFPVTILLHWLVPHRFRWMVLLAASYLFYMNWDLRLGALLFTDTLITYLAAVGIESQKQKKYWLAVGLTVPFTLLFAAKYAGFFLQNGNLLLRAAGLEPVAAPISYVLPAGISFYTFQIAAYVIDVYRGKLPAERHFGYYALFVSFFPQLVAGPIERAGDLLPQLKKERALRDGMVGELVFSDGVVRIMRGFFRKIAVADVLSVYVDRAFAAGAQGQGAVAAAGAVLFALQIYCDFAGYTDIAIGAAHLCGIRLSENFDHPYRAVGIRDFWRRWHKTLTGWFTKYVYIPLGGSRRGLGRWIINILIVFTLSGLWHGAAWHFVAWGLLHGAALSLEILITTRKHSGLWRSLSQAATFAFVCVFWIFFRAESVPAALTMTKSLLTGWSLGLPAALGEAWQVLGLTRTGVVHIGAALLCLILLERREKELMQPGSGRPLLIFLLAMAVLASWLLLMAGQTSNVFIYFQF